MICDRCKDPIPLIKPLHTCNVVDGSNYQWITYALCSRCADELREFLKNRNTVLEKEITWQT